MEITDALFLIAIMLLISMTVITVHRSCAPRRARRMCDGFGNLLGGITQREAFLGGSHDQPDALEEVVLDTTSRGLVPRAVQPQHTANLWKSDFSQPKTDDQGMRHTSFSSDLLTPYKDQYKLLEVDPEYKPVRAPHVRDTVWEPLGVGASCSDPISCMV